MSIPLRNRLKKRLHAEVASLQDEVVEVLYGIENGLVLHGGTAIWRCYGGSRFSEDLDFYCASPGKLEAELPARLSARGLELKKFKKTPNLIFCKVGNGEVEMRVEINFSVAKSAIAAPYEKTDGGFMHVFTLPPEELLLEKMGVYKNRKFIRDIYDIYYLSALVKDGKTLKEKMRGFLSLLPEPVDERNLKTLVYAGAVPSLAQIVEVLRARFG